MMNGAAFEGSPVVFEAIIDACSAHQSAE